VLGTVAPAELADARLQLHHAAQLAAALGSTFLEARSDDSHPNLGWDAELAAFVGHAAPAANGLRAALRPARLELFLVDVDAKRVDSLALAGMSLASAHEWLGQVLGRLDVVLPAGGLRRTDYEIPDHPVAQGAEFSAPGAAHEELARWFADGQIALSSAATTAEGELDLRIWPHHFDLGTLIPIATNQDGSLAQSIGFGLSPGDDSYPEPYYYVSPWPYPDAATLPTLPAGGRWHTTGFTSAILGAEDLLAGPPDGQEQRVRAFLEAAAAASRRALSAE